MKKIPVVGDIMNEPGFMEEARTEAGGYDYWLAFAPLQVLRDKGFAVTGAFADPTEDRTARFTVGDTRPTAAKLLMWID